MEYASAACPDQLSCLANAVLTTISQIDSLADLECNWQAAHNSLLCTFSVLIPNDNKTSANWQAVTRFSWCSAMVCAGDFLSRPAILSTAVMACATLFWAWLSAALTASFAINVNVKAASRLHHRIGYKPN
jgi:hypothetical protein